jgi:hypothetical protein
MAALDIELVDDPDPDDPAPMACGCELADEQPATASAAVTATPASQPTRRLAP